MLGLYMTGMLPDRGQTAAGGLRELKQYLCVLH